MRKELEALEADLDWLGGEVKRLRGKVTGGLRGAPASQDAPGPTNGGQPPTYLSPEWFKQQRAKLHIGGGS